MRNGLCLHPHEVTSGWLYPSIGLWGLPGYHQIQILPECLVLRFGGLSFGHGVGESLLPLSTNSSSLPSGLLHACHHLRDLSLVNKLSNF